MPAAEIEGCELDALFVFVPDPSARRPPEQLGLIAVEGETAGVALGRLRDTIADGSISEIAALTITASAEGSQRTNNLRALGYCASQMPRFECDIELSLQVEFGGLNGAVGADLGGGITGWRRIEQALFALADLGNAVGGTLTMRLTPPSPIAVEGSDWEQFRSVVANNNPGALRIEVEPAGRASTGGGQ